MKRSARSLREALRCEAYAEPFDEEYSPAPIAQGSVHDISSDSDERGFYLPNGQWHMIPKRRMGF